MGMLAAASGSAGCCPERGLGEARRARCRGCLAAQVQVEARADGFRVHVCWGCAPQLHVASNRASNQILACVLRVCYVCPHVASSSTGTGTVLGGEHDYVEQLIQC